MKTREEFVSGWLQASQLTAIPDGFGVYRCWCGEPPCAGWMVAPTGVCAPWEAEQGLAELSQEGSEG